MIDAARLVLESRLYFVLCNDSDRLVFESTGNFEGTRDLWLTTIDAFTRAGIQH